MVRFKFNPKFVWDKHSIGHFGLSLIGVVVLSFFTPIQTSFNVCLSIGIIWEIINGFQPWWTEAKGNWFQRNFLYADGFSWSDVVFDLSGCLVGYQIALLIT